MLRTPQGELNALLEISRRAFSSSPPISLCEGLDIVICLESTVKPYNPQPTQNVAAIKLMLVQSASLSQS